MCLRCPVGALRLDFGAGKGGEGKGDKNFRQRFNAKMKVSCLDIDVAILPV